MDRGLMEGIGFGAAYDPECQRRPDSEADFSLMAKVGFSVIRVSAPVTAAIEAQDRGAPGDGTPLHFRAPETAARSA